jgi:regulatory protein
MGVITGIVPDRRRAGRFAIEVDGRETGVVGIDGIERLGLRVGAAVSEQVLADEDAAVGVYDRAIRLLAVRARSVADLRRRLAREGPDPRHVTAAIERLVAAGVVDDAEYARGRVRSRLRSQGTSARRLRQELARDGVASDVAAEAVSEVFEDEAVDVGAVVEQIARRRAATLKGLDREVARRRLYGFLARRGYEADDVRRAVEKALAEGAG